MSNDTLLKREGMQVLSKALGLVEAERFIMLINREDFDYTKWQRDLFGDTPLKDFLKDAKSYSESLKLNR